MGKRKLVHFCADKRLMEVLCGRHFLMVGHTSSWTMSQNGVTCKHCLRLLKHKKPTSDMAKRPQQRGPYTRKARGWED